MSRVDMAERSASDAPLTILSAAMMPAAQAVGAMLGPGLGGWLISGYGFGVLLFTTAAGVVIAILFFSIRGSLDNSRTLQI